MEVSDSEDYAITLNKLTNEEVYRFGKQYYNEAKRILQGIPPLPKKYN